MTIAQGDIKILASQALDDVPEGGGAVTGSEIVDGASNNLFPDISSNARVTGKVQLRKVFAGVRTADTDLYADADMIVADAPDDPNVSAVLFSTNDAFDVRDSASSRVESYLVQGAAYAGLLFGNHIAGMRTINLLQRDEIAAPTVGTTLMLQYGAGTASERSQYVRATAVRTRVRTFTIPNATTAGQTFTRLEVIIDISAALEADYPGFEAAQSWNDTTANYTGRTRLFETVVADAARYYGISALAQPAEIGDFTVKAASIFTQLVPSAQIETAIADARMNSQATAAVVAGEPLVRTMTLGFSPSQALFVGGGILPGSLSIARDGTTLTDLGGRLYNGTTQVGTVDYANGIVSLSATVWASAGPHVVTLTPAAPPVVVTRSIGVPVTVQSQSQTVVVSLDPIPARASLQVSYLSGGRWYALADDGSGSIRGADSSLGAGTLNFDTGTCVVTAGALPDVGSQWIFSWAPIADQTTVTAASLENGARAYADVVIGAFKPGTLTLTWDDGTARTATDSAGALTGHATGKCWYGSGRLYFSPTTLPAPGTVVTYTLTDITQHEVTASSLTDSGASWTWTLPSAPIKPRSVRLGLPTSIPERVHPGVDVTVSSLRQVLDDGAGTLYVVHQTGNLIVGTINYTSGLVTITKSVAGHVSSQGNWERRTPTGGSASDPAYITFTGSSNRTTNLTFLGATTGISTTVPSWAWWTAYAGEAAWAQYGGADGPSRSGTFTMSALRLAVSTLDTLNLSYHFRQFRLGDFTYVAQASQIVTNPSPTTGEGTPAGTFSGYLSEITTWPAGASSLPLDFRATSAPSSLLHNRDAQVDAVVFRTATSPLKPGSFTLLGTWLDGSAFSATAGIDGVINTGTVFGKIDVQTGVVVLRFGVPTATPSTPASPPTGVVDLSYLGIPGVSWVTSKSAQADSLRYNAVAYTFVPIDEAMLGLDAVRLPPDGRVPIFRAGTIAVVHHTLTTSPATVTNGQTINLARTRIARVRVIGNNGQTIHNGYSANLDAGTVTFTNTTGYSQPVRIAHTIEDTGLVAEALITGDVRLTRPLTHNFPAGSSISSALYLGNLRARISAVFDQESWTNVWSDDLIGSTAGGTFDTINHPITTTNLGAVTERWAIRFTGVSAFQCYGEHLGLIGAGNITSEFAPLNPATGTPYFTVPATGWGSGWASNNVLRLNTVGAMAPVWIARVVQQGAATVSDDSFTVLVRGDIDTP